VAEPGEGPLVEDAPETQVEETQDRYGGAAQRQRSDLLNVVSGDDLDVHVVLARHLSGEDADEVDEIVLVEVPPKIPSSGTGILS
jgi:hypothetical protein